MVIGALLVTIVKAIGVMEYSLFVFAKLRKKMVGGAMKTVTAFQMTASNKIGGPIFVGLTVANAMAQRKMNWWRTTGV